MNKIATFGLGALAMLGVGAGAVAVVANAPATKDKFNISYGDKVLIGQETTKDTVVKDETDNNETNNLVAVTYVLDGEETTVLQEKGVLQGDFIDMDKFMISCLSESGRPPRCFLGWTKTPGEMDIVYKVEEDVTLYPVFNYQGEEIGIYTTCIGASGELVVDNPEDEASSGVTIPFDIDRDYSLMFRNSVGETLTLYAVGLVDVSDIEAGFVKEFVSGNEYIMQYYCPELDLLGDATDFEGKVDEFIYGDNLATKDEVLINVKYSSVEKEEAKPVSLYELSSCLSMSSSNTFNDELYYVKGYSTGVDSTELVSFADMNSETTYYAVYAKADDFYSSAVRLYSIQELEGNVG